MKAVALFASAFVPLLALALFVEWTPPAFFLGAFVGGVVGAIVVALWELYK